MTSARGVARAAVVAAMLLAVAAFGAERDWGDPAKMDRAAIGQAKRRGQVPGGI